MRDFIELLKAFGLFVSCLVIGYGGLFYFLLICEVQIYV